MLEYAAGSDPPLALKSDLHLYFWNLPGDIYDCL